MTDMHQTGDKSLVACTTPKAAKALGFASRATDGKENADANALHSTAEDKEKMMKRAKLMQSPTDTMVSPVSAALSRKRRPANPQDAARKTARRQLAELCSLVQVQL